MALGVPLRWLAGRLLEDGMVLVAVCWDADRQDSVETVFHIRCIVVYREGRRNKQLQYILQDSTMQGWWQGGCGE